jgi:hypothetical protein
VKENCADEEVGYFDYLSLYYCRLAGFPAVSFMIMTAWLVMLFTVKLPVDPNLLVIELNFMWR